MKIQVVIDVGINDTDANGVDGDFDFTTVITARPTHGEATLDFIGKIIYTPPLLVQSSNRRPTVRRPKKAPISHGQQRERCTNGNPTRQRQRERERDGGSGR